MKKKLIILLLIVFLIILGFLIFVLIKNFNNKEEKDYVSEFTKIGEETYSEYYYPILLKDKETEASVAEFLRRYETIGLTFDLGALRGYAINTDKNEYTELIKEFLNKNRGCTEANTMVIIYPKEPFKNTDFTSEIKMGCSLKK